MAAQTRTVVIGGERYEVRPLGKEHFTELKDFIRTRRGDPLAEAVQSLAGMEVDDATRRLILSEAIRQKSSTSVGPLEIEEFLATDDGVAFALWIALRDQREDFTYDDAWELMKAGLEEEQVRRRAIRAGKVPQPPEGWRWAPSSSLTPEEIAHVRARREGCPVERWLVTDDGLGWALMPDES